MKGFSYHSSVCPVLDEIFLVARTEETNAELCRQQISPEVEQRQKHLKNCYAPPL